MDFNIPDKELARLACDPNFTGGHSGRLVKMFRQTLQIVAAVPDESSLEAFKCLDYRKFTGRKAIRRLALTEDAYLVVRMKTGSQKPMMIIEEIHKNGRKRG